MSTPDGTVTDELLDEIEEYLDDRADVKDDGEGGVMPNRAMRLLGRLREERGGIR